MQLRPGEHARRRRAVLAGVEVAGDLDALDDGLEVRVVEHDHRRLAAQLEVHPLQRVGRGARDLLAGRDVAGERDHRDVGVAHEARAGRLAVAEDHVQHALRQVLGRELGEPRGRQRRLLGGLQHDRVAGRQRRADLPDRHHQRVVPGRDLADDADRLAADHRRVAAHVLARRPGPSRVRAAPGEEAQVVDQDRDLLACIASIGLPTFSDSSCDELVAVLLERVGDPQQRQGALARAASRTTPGRRAWRPARRRRRRPRRTAAPSRSARPVAGFRIGSLDAVRGRAALAVDEVLDLGGLCDGRHRSLL